MRSWRLTAANARCPTTNFTCPAASCASLDPPHPRPVACQPRSSTSTRPRLPSRPEAVARGVRPLAWFPNATPLRSGWAWGQHYLKDVTAFEAPIGDGSGVRSKSPSGPQTHAVQTALQRAAPDGGAVVERTARSMPDGRCPTRMAVRGGHADRSIVGSAIAFLSITVRGGPAAPRAAVTRAYEARQPRAGHGP